jgi:hypothetical protein
MWGIKVYQQNHMSSIIFLILVLLGMTYDNLIIVLGKAIAEGRLLQLLNRLRFIFHNLLVPLLVITVTQIAGDAGVTWAQEPMMQYGNWAIAAILVVFGLFTVSRQQDLIAVSCAGTLRYKPKISRVPITTLLTAALVAVVGGYIWSMTQWPWMLIGTLVMLGVNALPKTILTTLASSAVDCIFAIALLVTAIIIH